MDRKVEDIKKEIANLKREEDQIFSRDEYQKQVKYESSLKSIWAMVLLGIILGVVGVVVGFRQYNAGGHAAAPIYLGAAGVAIGVVIGFIIRLINNSLIKKKFKPADLKKYRELEQKIYNCEIDIKELDAVANRKNKLFIGLVRTGVSMFHSFELDITIDGVSYGEINGVSVQELEPGRHVIGGKFSCSYSNTRSTQYFTINKVLQSVVVNVGDNGSFVYLSLNIPSYDEGRYYYQFSEVSSKEFNELMNKLGKHEYY